jgi:hypothetical protein
MSGERMQLTLLIRTPDSAQDSMIVRSWYTEGLCTGRARGLVPQTPYLQSLLDGGLSLWRRVILERMLDNMPASGRILVAQLHGESERHARLGELAGDERAAAVAAVRELAGGRGDLLAHVAGILEGFSTGEPDEAKSHRTAPPRCAVTPAPIRS